MINALILSFLLFPNYNTQRINESDQDIAMNNYNQDDFSDIGFDVEKVEYVTEPQEFSSESFDDYHFENDFDYQDHTIFRGNERGFEGIGTAWSENPDDEEILELVIGDDDPFILPALALYYTMEAKITIVSYNTFEKQNDSTIGGAISWKWDVNGHEIGWEANLFYTFAYMKVISGTGYSLDAFTLGTSLDASGEGDPTVRRGETTIPDFDSIIDPDGKLRFEVSVFAKGFVAWLVVEDKDVYADIEIHGLAARQDIVALFNYDNNFDYNGYEILEGDFRHLSGTTSAWSEDPDDGVYMSLNLQDTNPTLGNFEYLYNMEAKLHLVSHNTFTLLNNTALGGMINWKWDVNGHEIGNGANLYYSAAIFEIISGTGFIVDTYSLGSTSGYTLEGDPETRKGTSVIPTFDAIIDTDGKIRLTITLEARGWVSWWGTDDKDVWTSIVLYGLSVKQNIKMEYEFNNDFNKEDYTHELYCVTRYINGVGSSWSEDPQDDQILEYVIGDDDPWYDVTHWVYRMGGKLYTASQNRFTKQNDPRFAAVLSYTYDITSHNVGTNAHLFYSIGGLYILKSNGDPVPISQFVEGNSGDYAASGDPARRTGTIVLENFDQFIDDRGYLHFYLDCYAEGAVDWLIVEDKDVSVGLEMWGLSVYQEVHPPDPTAPEVIISYVIGDRTDGNPGYWFVSAYDNESGINNDTILIFIDDVLVGTTLGFYDVPNSLGSHTIKAYIYNNHPADAMRTFRASTINIIDDDTTSPLITIDYLGSGLDDDPGYFEWTIVDYDDGVGGDYDSGVSDIIINVMYESTDGSENFNYVLPPNEVGIWHLNASLGEYTINIYANDNDDDRESQDSLPATVIKTQMILDDDITGPEITIAYVDGDGTDGNAGFFEWTIYDYQSHLSYAYVKINYESTEGLANYSTYVTPNHEGTWQLPSNLGIYSIEILARDGDFDRGTIDYSTNQSTLIQEIIDDDITAPIVTNLYTEIDSQYVNISFIATDESGIGEITIYIDGVAIVPISLDVYVNTYNITIANEWSEVNVTHELEIVVFDLDNDRSNDTLNSTLFDNLNVYVVTPTTPLGYTGYTILLLIIPTIGLITILTKKLKKQKIIQL